MKSNETIRARTLNLKVEGPLPYNEKQWNNQGSHLEFKSGRAIYQTLSKEAPPWLAPTSEENFEKYAL